MEARRMTERKSSRPESLPLAEQVARFVSRAEFRHIPPDALDRLKRNLLDSLGCAFGALDGPPVRLLAAQVERLGGKPEATLIGGGRTAIDRAASFNTALTRYLDFMDSFLAEGETCHPSDNIGSVLAAAETAGRSGEEFLTALAVAYEVECRLTQQLPVMNASFDHTTQLAMSIAAGIAKAHGFGTPETTNAIAIAAVDFATLAVIRASKTSQWKGLASSAVAFGVTHSTLLAGAGITGPQEAFEGPKGWFEATGKKTKIDWSDRTLDAVLETTIKRYNAEVHTQSALEALLDLKRANGFKAGDVKRVEIDTFMTAYDIVGGGQYGDRKTVQTKEQADHSLPYLAAVALLDGEVMPEQFTQDRILRDDVQDLLRRVDVRPSGRISKPKPIAKKIDPYTRAYPEHVPTKVSVTLADGRAFSLEKRSHEGFRDQPMSWDRVIEKFERLSSRATTQPQRDAIVEAVRDLEKRDVADLTRLLGTEETAPAQRRGRRTAA
jgi:2-methylcitrate dehydratase